jgi:hypothetical protein
MKDHAKDDIQFWLGIGLIILGITITVIGLTLHL